MAFLNWLSFHKFVYYFKEDDEFVLEGAQAEDTEAEYVLKLLEDEIVCGSGALGQYRKFVLDICEKPQQFNNMLLQKAITTTLMRLKKGS